MSSLLMVVTAALGAALLGVGLLLRAQRQTRRQVELLMDRIDQLQQRVPGRVEPDSPATAIPSRVFDGDADAGAELSQDVLAGRTSFVRRAVDGELSQPASLAGQAIVLIHAHIGDSLTPAEVAEELAISLRTLERGLAAELGCSPRQLILAMKMREARRLLSTGRLRVNEVSNQLGFANPSHFSRSFRTFYRMPPSRAAREPSWRSTRINH